MKNIIIILPVVLLWALSGIAQNTGIIPQPLRVDMEEWEFIITSNTPIIADRPNQENASYLQELLKVEYKKELQIKRKGGKGIILNLNPSLAQKLGKRGIYLKSG